MANEDDYEGGGGSGFVMGLLTGTVLGAGLGMLFAPKSGTELRGQISDTASSAGRAASDQYRKATEAASGLADRGRQLYGKAKDAVGWRADEPRRHSSDAPREGESTSGSGSAGGGEMGTPPQHAT